MIWTNGGQNRSWSAEYFPHSRCQWEPRQLFRPILKRALEHCPQRLAGVALDDTKLRETGRSIPQAFYRRDPWSPPFHVNLVLGLRFLQASLLLPLHRSSAVGARALPIRLEEVSHVKHPGKKATGQMQQQYREAAKQQNLSRRLVAMGQGPQQRASKCLAVGSKEEACTGRPPARRVTASAPGCRGRSAAEEGTARGSENRDQHAHGCVQQDAEAGC
jgi:hypothetical protein